MQPEPTAVSQHTPPIDSPPVNTRSTQHGHDLDDAQVSGFLREETRDLAAVSSMLIQDNFNTSLNDQRSAPPSERVSQHANAAKQSDNVGLRVAFVEESETNIQAFPNGNGFETPT